MKPIEATNKAAARLSGTAASIIKDKGTTVHSVSPGDTVYAAVAKLKELQIGALLVMEGLDLVGIVSERDYARKIILEGRASKATLVSEIMSTPVITVATTTPLIDCMQLMNERRIRHLPVMDGIRLVGLMSSGDLLRSMIVQQGETIDQLNTLITDPYPG
jgi:CBS domain-containing protein